MESAVKFGRASSKVGILRVPDESSGGPLFVIPSAGLIHRIGPNRLNVQLAREVGSLGYPAFCFDFNGIGDSEHEIQDGNLVEQALEALDFLDRRFSSFRYVFVGLCSAAVVAFHCAAQDDRVVGAGLLSPLGDGLLAALDPAAHAESMWRSYRSAAFDVHRWPRLLFGKSDYRRLASSWLHGMKQRVFTASSQPDNVIELRDAIVQVLRRGKRVLMVYSETGGEPELLDHLDLTAHLDTVLRGRLTTHPIEHSDHTFTPLGSQKQLLAVVRTWAREFAPSEAAAAGALTPP